MSLGIQNLKNLYFYHLKLIELYSMGINRMGKQISCLTQSVGCFVELMTQSGILSSH